MGEKESWDDFETRQACVYVWAEREGYDTRPVFYFERYGPSSPIDEDGYPVATWFGETGRGAIDPPGPGLLRKLRTIRAADFRRAHDRGVKILESALKQSAWEGERKPIAGRGRRLYSIATIRAMFERERGKGAYESAPGQNWDWGHKTPTASGPNDAERFREFDAKYPLREPE